MNSLLSVEALDSTFVEFHNSFTIRGTIRAFPLVRSQMPTKKGDRQILVRFYRKKPSSCWVIYGNPPNNVMLSWLCSTDLGVHTSQDRSCRKAWQLRSTRPAWRPWILTLGGHGSPMGFVCVKVCESVWKGVKVCERVWKGVCVCLSLSLSVRLFFSWAIDCWINSWAMTLMTQVSIQIIQGEAWPTSCGLSWGQEGMDWYNRYVNISSQMVHLHYVQTKNRQMQQIRIRFLSLVGGFNLPLWKILVTICYYSQSQYMEKKKHVGVSENSVSLNPMVNDHYPY